MRNLIRRAAFGVGLYPSRLTKAVELQELLNRLRPVHPGIELVRFGPDGDGGYLVPDDLEGIQACYSPGVDRIAGFELECALRGMEVYMADYSVDQPPEMHERFHFQKKFLGAVSTDVYTTMDEWVTSTDETGDGDLILQMDIEGAEYEVLMSTSDAILRRFRMIAMEIHCLDQLWNKPYFNLATRVFDKLLKNHVCVHNHPNNGCGSMRIGSIELPLATEMAFLRKDRVRGQLKYVKHFPHPLDREGNTNLKPLVLPKCWYKD